MRSNRELNRSWPLATFALAMLLLPEAASAVLTKDQQNCVRTQNKNLTKVAKTIGKEMCTCVRNISKGKDNRTVLDCLNADDKGKVAKAKQKALDDLMSQVLAVLMHNGIIRLERVAQDGMRVRACAGAWNARGAPCGRLVVLGIPTSGPGRRHRWPASTWRFSRSS